MLEIFLFSLLTSIQIIISGYLFHHLFISKKSSDLNIFTLGLLGFVFIGFIGIFLNFFVSLNKFLNDIFFILPFLLFCIFFFNNIIFKKILFFSILISIFFTITVAFDNHYIPDAGSYHLPFVSILNENKIIIGSSNLHYRFGHTSIMQYISALYNNHLFGDNGISIPLGLLYCFFVGFLIVEILNSKDNRVLYIFLFIILSFVLFRMNRYSDLGNDGPANIFFFYLIVETLKNYSVNYKIRITSILAVFIFLNKITLLLGFLIPIYLIFKNFNVKAIINKTNIFSFIFLSLFILKNFFVSGCLAFPLEQSCIKKVFWFNDQNSYNVKYVRAENEAWTKGCPNQNEPKKNHFDYISNFEWFNTWKFNHGKVIIKKISPFLIFLSIMSFFLYFSNKKALNLKNFKEKMPKGDFLNYFLIGLCLTGSLIWFFKFPVFRYGYGYLISFFAISLSMLLKSRSVFYRPEKLNKNIMIIFVVLLCGVSVKNLIRIASNYENINSAWPQIYSNDQKYTKQDHKPVFKNSKILFYKNEKNTCYYSTSPCTHLLDFNLDNLNIMLVYGYKVYYFK